MTTEHQTPEAQTPEHQERGAPEVQGRGGSLRRPPSRTVVRVAVLALLAVALLTAQFAPPQTEHGQVLLRLLQVMTLLALVTVAFVTRRQGRAAQAALLAIPVLGVLIAGTVGADVLMDGAVNLIILYPATCAAVVLTGGLLILAALLGEALSEDR